MVLKLRPFVTVAGIYHNFKGCRMAEWLRPADCEVLTIKLRGINYQVAHLVSEKDHTVRRVGFNHVRDSIWRRHLPIFCF